MPLTLEHTRSCTTIGDLQAVIENQTLSDLEDYLDAVEVARHYVELTMRDEFILNSVRSAHDKMIGKLKSHTI